MIGLDGKRVGSGMVSEYRRPAVPAPALQQRQRIRGHRGAGHYPEFQHRMRADKNIDRGAAGLNSSPGELSIARRVVRDMTIDNFTVDRTRRAPESSPGDEVRAAAPRSMFLSA